MQLCELIQLIIQELYGKDPASVAQVLFLKNKSSFKQLQILTGLPEQNLRNSLTVLMQHLIVSFEEKPRLVYLLNSSEVLARLRFPRYIRLINLKFGEESCVEDILENGCCSITQLIESARDSHRSPELVSQILREMVLSDYLLPVDKKIEVKEAVHIKKAGRPQKRPKIELPSLPVQSKALPSAEVATNSDFYRLNFRKINKEMVSEVIGSLVSGKTNLNCGIIAECMFKLGYRGVTRAEIISALPAVPKIPSAAVDLSLEGLEKAGLATKDTEISWKLNLPHIHNQITSEIVEKIIQGRFGDYSSRVFRILFNKGNLDDKTISDLTLLPLKETNTSINELFAAGFIHSKSVGVSQLHFSVNIEDVRQDLLLQCYKSVYNLKIKLASEMEEVWGLVQRIGFLSSEEKQLLERYKQIESRIESAILELDRSILIFSLEY